MVASWHGWWQQRNRWERTALVVWTIIVLVVSTRVLIFPTKKTVYPIFSQSAQLWWSQTDLYYPHRPAWAEGGFRYSPAFTILTTPFSCFSEGVGGVLWRLFNLGALGGALYWWGRSAVPLVLTRAQLACLMVLVIPLTLQSFNNGQANLLVAACLVGTMAAVKNRMWWLASALLALAFACKIYPIVLGLLLLVLYPRQLSWRLPLAILGVLLFPFLFAPPEYVVDQYHKWISNIRADDRSQMNFHSIYRDFWMLIRLYDWPISRPIYEILQVAAGGVVAGVCIYRQRSGWSEQALLTSTLALGTAWMILLGPATESCTFILIAPSLALAVILACTQRALHWNHGLLAASVVILLTAVVLASFPKASQYHALGLHPWASLCFFLYLFTDRRPGEIRAGPASGGR